MDVKKMHEWLLAIEHRDALKREDYKTCQLIQDEVDRRIETDTINHALMNGFKKYDHETNSFYGDPKFEPYNGLFKNYIFKK
jgi:hypothetical protein